ncbi:MAG: DUF1569 domain-containing protein [Burkholderiales bacterium]|nr:DUF1569 domain-containing protein [Burkholderiales bacterium]
MPPRRALLIAGGGLLIGPLAGCNMAEVQTFPTLAAAMKAIESLAEPPGAWKGTGAWTLAQMLEHAAQSVEYSLRGFPQPKGALFQATVGKAAFAVFDARGRMSHSLAEAIPGAPAIDAKAPLAAAIARVQRALREFEAHTGPLAPHFAYGALDKAQYTRAHLMHLANHWTEVRKDTA